MGEREAHTIITTALMQEDWRRALQRRSAARGSTPLSVGSVSPAAVASSCSVSPAAVSMRTPDDRSILELAVLQYFNGPGSLHIHALTHCRMVLTWMSPQAEQTAAGRPGASPAPRIDCDARARRPQASVSFPGYLSICAATRTTPRHICSYKEANSLGDQHSLGLPPSPSPSLRVVNENGRQRSLGNVAALCWITHTHWHN